ncbi:hypothetical protein ZIOFF_063225 [Zingiber officinale]|uniref:Uncharacterized protein n=1 Tax=Zingiber officinale TaxID=94328 RepID=A0A8J5F6C9_ZINOF|nr:hypothetical protein ZIOFF_063225 [Zingiber officinale]
MPKGDDLLPASERQKRIAHLQVKLFLAADGAGQEEERPSQGRGLHPDAGTIKLGTLLVRLGYGAHWAIVPAAASELFGLKNFGALYNFLTVANPTGSLIFSGLIASVIYDYEASQRAQKHHKSLLRIRRLFEVASFSGEETVKCTGAICFFLSSLIMSGLCAIAVVLSLILIYRTRIVYRNLYSRTLK